MIETFRVSVVVGADLRDDETASVGDVTKEVMRALKEIGFEIGEIEVKRVVSSLEGRHVNPRGRGDKERDGSGDYQRRISDQHRVIIQNEEG